MFPQTVQPSEQDQWCAEHGNGPLGLRIEGYDDRQNAVTEKRRRPKSPEYYAHAPLAKRQT